MVLSADDVRRLFASLGLTDQEIKIYNVLLQSGSSLAGDITQRSGVHRRNVYDCLERLIQKGLVGYILENNRKRYSVTNPRHILERRAKEESAWQEIMPELLAAYQSHDERKETIFYRGVSGIRMVMEDQLDVGQEVLVLATTVDVGTVLRHFFLGYQSARKARKIPTRMLFDVAAKRSGKKIAALPLCKARYMKSLNTSAMSQYIYGDNVAIVVWNEEPVAILIRQKEIAQGFRESFELLWRLAK